MSYKEKILSIINADDEVYNAVKNEFDNTVPPRLKSWLDVARKEIEERNTENISEQERWKKGL